MSEQPDLTPDEQRLAAAAGDLLRRSADELDATTRSRLNRGQQAALAGLRPAGARRGWLMPAFSSAAVALLIVSVWVGRGVDPVPAPEQTAANPLVAQDLDILLGDENLEMMEGLEFYAWLDPALSAAELQAELEAAG